MLEHPYLAHYKIKPKSMNVDLGATTGDFLKEILPTLKETNSRLLCIEPSVWAVPQLSVYIDIYAQNHASLLSCAVGKEHGFVSFTCTNSALLNHLTDIPQNFPHKMLHTKLVSMITLDTVIEICGGHIDFIKCDIEGAELDAFLSCKSIKSIDNFAIAAYHIVDHEPTYKKLIPFFEANEFKITTYSIPNDNYSFMIYGTKEK